MGVADQLVSVLIVEDDFSVAESLQEVFERFGFTVSHAKDPSDALSKIQAQSFNYIFVDCMLPLQNGVDFVAENIALFQKNKSQVVLMSGVLKDPAFIKYALSKTQAADFMVKPFSMDQILKVVRRDVAKKENVSPRQNLYAIFQDESLTERERKRIVLLQDELKGWDLIALYNVIFDLKLSGTLHIEWGDKKAAVSISEGVVVAVDMNDPETKIGGLLLENQFVLPEDLNEVLNSPLGGGRLGQRLIQANKLSPHAFDLVFVLQMKIRLNKTLAQSVVNVSFSDSDVVINGVYLDTDDLFKELETWIEERLTLAHIEEIFQLTKTQSFLKSAHYRIDHPAFSSRLLMSLPGLLTAFENEVTIDDLKKQFVNTEKLYKALYLLMSKGLICGAALANAPVEPQPVTPAVPEPIPLSLAETSPGIALPPATEVEMSNTLSDETTGRADFAALMALNQLELALQQGKNAEAHALLEQILKETVKAPELGLYQAWVQLTRLEMSLNRLQALKNIEAHLASVPEPYNRSMNFYYVKAVNLKHRQHYAEAKELLLKAVEMSPTNMMIKRELMQVNSLLQAAKSA